MCTLLSDIVNDVSARATFVAAILGAIATFLAAYTGPRYAYKLESTRREKEDNDRIFNELNRSMVTAVQHWNMAMYLSQTIEPASKNPQGAWLNLTMIMPGQLKIESHDSKLLGHLLDLKKSTLYQALINAEQDLVNTFQKHEQFATNAISKIWSKLEAAGVPFGELRPEDEMKAIVGPVLVRIQSVLAETLLKETPELTSRLKGLVKQMRDTLIQLFPDKTPFNVTGLDS